MKKFFLTCLNDCSVVTAAIIATKISSRSVLYGCIAFAIVFVLLDFHTYFSKKLNFHNNLFIKD